MLFSVLKKVSLKGKLDIIDYKGNLYSFGSQEAENQYVKIKLTNRSIQRKIFFNPSLYIGEGYMNEEIIIEIGTIEDFVKIISKAYDDFFFK